MMKETGNKGQFLQRDTSSLSVIEQVLIHCSQCFLACIGEQQRFNEGGDFATVKAQAEGSLNAEAVAASFPRLQCNKI